MNGVLIVLALLLGGLTVRPPGPGADHAAINASARVGPGVVLTTGALPPAARSIRRGHTPDPRALTVQEIATPPRGPGALAQGLAVYLLSDMMDALMSARPAATPTLPDLALLLLPYLLLVGLGASILLRRRRWRTWGWLTVSAVALAICGAVLPLGRDPGPATSVTSVSIVHMLGVGMVSPTETYLGLSAPTNGRYQVTVHGLTTNGPDGAGRSTPASVALDRLPAGSRRFLLLRHWTAGAGSLEAHLVLRPDGTIAGAVVNHTSRVVMDAAVATANGAVYLGTLAPGGSRPVRITSVTTRLPNVYGSVPGVYRLYETVDLGLALRPVAAPSAWASAGWSARAGSCGSCPPYYVPQGASPTVRYYLEALRLAFPEGALPPWPPAIVLGWTRQPLPALQVNGRTPQRSALNLMLALPLVTLPRGLVHLLEGVLSPQVIARTGTVEGTSEDLMIGPRSSATLALTLPRPEGRLVARTLTMSAAPSPGTLPLAAITVSLYNWARHTWRVVDLSSGQITLPHASPYVSPAGKVMVRLATPDSGGIFFESVREQFRIGLDGDVLPR